MRRLLLIGLAMLSSSAACAQNDNGEAPLSSPNAEHYRENLQGIPGITPGVPGTDEQSSPPWMTSPTASTPTGDRGSIDGNGY